MRNYYLAHKKITVQSFNKVFFLAIIDQLKKKLISLLSIVGLIYLLAMLRENIF